ncbi:MAG: Rid family detoxifying hydrolase [Spirochaetales bacterium]
MSITNVIQTKEAPLPGGHYSQGLVAGGFLFVSGQLPLDPKTGALVPGGVEEQTLQALKNLEAIVVAAGLNKEHIVKVTVYVADISLWGTINRVYGDFFRTHKPARAVVPTGPLHYGSILEVEATAVLS